jgi:hypothetical protein
LWGEGFNVVVVRHNKPFFAGVVFGVVVVVLGGAWWYLVVGVFQLGSSGGREMWSLNLQLSNIAAGAANPRLGVTFRSWAPNYNCGRRGECETPAELVSYRSFALPHHHIPFRPYLFLYFAQAD